jgi:hypothetical protein
MLTDRRARSEFAVAVSRLDMRVVMFVLTDSAEAATFTCLVTVADAR